MPRIMQLGYLVDFESQALNRSVLTGLFSTEGTRNFNAFFYGYEDHSQPMNEIRLREFLDMRDARSAVAMFAASGYGCSGSWDFSGMGWSLPDNDRSIDWTGAFAFCGYGPGGTLSLGSGDRTERCYFTRCNGGYVFRVQLIANLFNRLR